MSNTFKITVQNQTGGAQNYSFFSAPAQISGGQAGQVRSHVLKAASNTPNGGRARLEVSTNYFAICGSYEGSPDSGARVSIGITTPVKLGSQSNGQVTGGSSVDMTVEDESYCNLSSPQTPGRGKVGAFEIGTANARFTPQDARNNNWLIGIGTSPDGNITQALASFTPSPGASYQIQPTTVFYVAAGEKLSVGQTIQADRMSFKMAVDFSARGTNDVTLIHNEEMEFRFA